MIECTVCGKDQDEDNFPSNGDGKGGRRKQCKECMREINKEWRKLHKDKVALYNKNRPKKTS